MNLPVGRSATTSHGYRMLSASFDYGVFAKLNDISLGIEPVTHGDTIERPLAIG